MEALKILEICFAHATTIRDHEMGRDIPAYGDKNVTEITSFDNDSETVLIK
jgi:hypothetical protein